MDTSTIDQIIATERQRYRWRTFWSWISLVTLFGGIVVSHLSESGIVVLPILTAHPDLGGLIGWLISFGIMVIAFPLTRPPKDAAAPEVLQRQIETFQGRYRSWLVFVAGIMVIFAALETIFPDALPGYFAPPYYAMNWFGTLYVLVALHAVLSARRRPHFEIPGGIDFNDELVRELRLKATRIGFVAVMVALAGTYLWILYHPMDARLILPWILAGGIAVAAVTFAVMHARAGREA